MTFFLLQFSSMTKRVVVQMADTCHKALKQYAAFYGMTMSEVLYNCTRMQFHKQASDCEFVEDMFDKLDIDLDKRALKPCFSFLCFGCKHVTACKVGLYKGVVELTGLCVDNDLVTPEGKTKVTKFQIEAGQEPQFGCVYGPTEDETHLPRTRTSRKHVITKTCVPII